MNKANIHADFISTFKKNFALEPLKVEHKNLKRFSDSIFKSECPNCNDGLLLVGRNIDDMTLQINDTCTDCGRRFIYTDIVEGKINLEYKSTKPKK